MSYERHEWETKEQISAERMNAIEAGIEAADAATERTDISDYVTMADDADGSVVCAYALGGWVFLQLLISNTETSAIDIAAVRAPYRPVKQSFGFYANLSGSYANAMLYTRIQTGGGISARFTMATSGSYLTYIYPIA